MEELDVKKKEKVGSRFRVTLSQETFDRVTRWADQIQVQRKGAKVRTGDLVEFILMSHAEALTNTELKDFQEKYVSDLDLAKWLVKELAAAEKVGQKLSIADLVATSKPKTPAVRVPRKIKEPGTESEIGHKN